VKERGEEGVHADMWDVNDAVIEKAILSPSHTHMHYFIKTERMMRVEYK
jgi:hypothetical protein